MKIVNDIDLKNFEFWAGAKENAKYFTEDDFEIIEIELDSNYPLGIDEVLLNDIFWFEMDFLSQFIGYDDFEDMIEKRGV